MVESEGGGIVKIITLWQPWASLVALELKRYETRHWKTNYRGTIAIHAAKRKVKQEEILPILYGTGGGGVEHTKLERLDALLNSELPLGAIVAIADLVGCLKMNPDYEFRQLPGFISLDTPSALEKAVGDWKSGRYAWKLENIQALSNPIPYRGSQGIGNVSEEVQEQIRKQLALPPADRLEGVESPCR
jgi:hypothetical protein